MDRSQSPPAPPAPVPGPPPDRDPLAAAPLPWKWELAAHVAAAVATVAILAAGLNLDQTTDFHAPFQYSEDALLILPFVKATVERGSHWRTDRLGAPGIQELHDFPVVDHFHFAAIRLLGFVFPDPVVVFNVFHLLTYPLTTVTTMFVLRRFGLSVPAAAAGGVLYAFAPYHQLRGLIHYFLSAYYLIPLGVMVCLWLCRGRLPFFHREPGGRYRFTFRTWDTLWAVLVAAASSAGGAYYAFYTCAFLAVSGVYGWAFTRDWRAAASAALVTAVVVAGGVANHLPAFVYQYRYGQNSRPTQRWAEESEMYGMKLSQLCLPIPGHNNIELDGRMLLDLSGVRVRYDSAMRPLHGFRETDFSALGLVATVGFVGLLAAAVLRGPWLGRPGGPVGPLAALTVFGTLFGTVGGAGDLFNLLVTPQIRCHNRVSIFLAFFAVFAVCVVIDRFFSEGGRRKAEGGTNPSSPLPPSAFRLPPWSWWRWPAFAGLVAFGLWDQTDTSWFPLLRPRQADYRGADDIRAEVAETYYADGRFFAAVEARVPDGMVFCYPVVPYPEVPPYEEPGSPGRVASYDMVRGYLHTATVRWSFGGLKGREWDEWAREVGAKPVPELVERIVHAGFDGLLVDRRGLNPARFDRIGRELNEVLGHGSDRVAHEDGSLVFYDLREYRRYLEQTYGADRFAAAAAAERERVSWLWLKGFDSYEPIGYERRQRWCKEKGLVVVVNPTDRPRTVRVRMTVHTWFAADAAMTITGDVWAERLTVNEKGVRVERDLVVPPGRHSVRFRCPLPDGFTFADSRDLVFGVKDFSLRELP